MNLQYAGGAATSTSLQATSLEGMHTTKRHSSLEQNVGSNEPPNHHAHRREPISTWPSAPRIPVPPTSIVHAGIRCFPNFRTEPLRGARARHRWVG